MSSNLPGESRRKRVRKGTKSCWECKRRKVKCIPSKDASVCAGCLERGILCLSQEYTDDPSLQHDSELPLTQRMARVESLLETLLERMTQSQPGQLATPSVLSTSNEWQPLSRSLHNGYESQAEISCPTGRHEALHQKLAALLLQFHQNEVDFLLASSHGWWLIQQHITPYSLSANEIDFEESFNIAAVSKLPPIPITRTLLCIAICIQQLSPELNTQNFRGKVPLQEMMRNIMDFVVQNVTSDDSLTGSVQGIECLAFQAIYEVNAGNLRRSWVTFRKAITIAHLQGLHNMTVNSPPEERSVMEIKRHHLWYHIARGERYLSTLLGLPSSTGSAAFPADADDSWLSAENVYHKHLYYISGLILLRNQSDSTHTFSTSQRIGEQLMSFAEKMPPAWWEVPTSIPKTRSKEAFAQFERVMCQIWHFQLEMLVYLPFMLRAATDRRYEHSHISCMNASRNLIKRWTSIRESSTTILYSNLLEFEAFIAATTLLLGILASPKSASPDFLKERSEDFQLVQTVVEHLERLKRQGAGMSVGNQSIDVIRTLQQFVHGRNSPNRLRLEVPFFGVIMIANNGAVQPLEGERILGANPSKDASLPRTLQTAVPLPNLGTGLTSNFTPESTLQLRDTDKTKESYSIFGMGDNETALQATGGHFQLPQAPGMQEIFDSTEWLFQESDTIYFDSLMDTDLEGNWAF